MNTTNLNTGKKGLNQIIKDETEDCVKIGEQYSEVIEEETVSTFSLRDSSEETMSEETMSEETMSEEEIFVANYIDSKVGHLNSLKTVAKENLVEAVNELFQDVDSGKTLIADAIDDEAITKDSTFMAMSEAIIILKKDVEDLVAVTKNDTEEYVKDIERNAAEESAANKQLIIDAFGSPLSNENSFEELNQQILFVKSIFYKYMELAGYDVTESDDFFTYIDALTNDKKKSL